MDSVKDNASKLREFLLMLKGRSDIETREIIIGEPVSEDRLTALKGILPESLLEFYTIMNGCGFHGSFRNSSELSIAFHLPPIEEIGRFISSDPDFNFQPGISFLPFEWGDPTVTSFFIIENGGDRPEESVVVSCYAGREREYLRRYDDMGGFIEDALRSSLVVLWQINDSFRKNQIRKVKSLLSAPPAKKKGLNREERIIHERAGRGVVIETFELGDKHEYHPDDWALVEYYRSGRRIWTPVKGLRKLPKKMELLDLALTAPHDFIASLSDYSYEETAMLFASLGGYSRERSITLEGISIPENSCDYYGILRHLPAEEFFGPVSAMLKGWFGDIKKGLLEEREFRAKKGKFKISERNYGWKYFDVIHSLLGSIALYLNEMSVDSPGFTLPENFRKSCIECYDLLKGAPVGGNDYEQSAYSGSIAGLNELIKWITEFKPVSRPVSFLFAGSKMPEDLSERGLNGEYSVII